MWGQKALFKLIQTLTKGHSKKLLHQEDKMGPNIKQWKQWRPLQGNGSPPRKGKGLAGAQNQFHHVQKEVMCLIQTRSILSLFQQHCFEQRELSRYKTCDAFQGTLGRLPSKHWLLKASVNPPETKLISYYDSQKSCLLFTWWQMPQRN